MPKDPDPQDQIAPGGALAARIADHLRREILTGALPPGARVKERETARDMGVSRTPMREAVRILAQEGLVELRAARSAVVAAPSLQDIHDNIEVMIALEVLSGQLACTRASEADLGRLRQLHQALTAAHDKVHPLDLFEIDMAFHKAIAAASGNPVLARTHGDLLARLWRARYLGASQRRNRDRVIDQHARILKALEARDPSATAAAITRHLQNLAEHITDVMEREGDTS